MANNLTLALGKNDTLADIAPDLDKAGWQIAQDAGAIYKKFRFTDFPAAMAFMSRVAFAADSADHHPEWFNVYNRVEVTLTSHDANGVTERDLALARVMESHAANTGNEPG